MDIDRDIQNTPPYYALGLIVYSIERSLEFTQNALDMLNKLLEEKVEK